MSETDDEIYSSMGETQKNYCWVMYENHFPWLLAQGHSFEDILRTEVIDRNIATDNEVAALRVIHNLFVAAGEYSK